MIHDHEWKRAIACRANHVGDSGQRDRNRPHLLLQRSICWQVLGESGNGQAQDDDDRECREVQQLSKHVGLRYFAAAGVAVMN